MKSVLLYLQGDFVLVNMLHFHTGRFQCEINVSSVNDFILNMLQFHTGWFQYEINVSSV